MVWDRRPTLFTATLKGDFNRELRKLALKLGRAIIMRTPVDTGRARGNWICTVAVPSEEIKEFIGESASAATQAAINGMSEVFSQAKIGEVYFMSNNVNYIGFLEHGSSSQAPRGMVKLSLAEIQALYT